MNVAAYFWSDKFAIRASKAQLVSEEEAPDLHKMVNELSELYQVPKPRVYMIPSEQPNAFATGRNPKHAAVAVTQGLLQHMPYDQVRAVMAHEFAHIKNRDILVSSIAAMIAGAVSAIGNIFFFTAMFGGDDDDSPLGAFGAILLMIIGPLAAALLQLGVSRQREYLADATAARMLREGRPLADALENLETARHIVPMQVNPATETLYIVNPFSGGGRDEALLDAPADRGQGQAPPRVRPRRRHPLRLATRTCAAAAEGGFGGADAGCSLRRPGPRSLVVRAGAARARADEARPPPPSVSREVHPAARRGAARAIRPGGRARARPLRRLGDDARAVARERPRRGRRRHRRVQLPAHAGQDRALQRVHAREGAPRRLRPPGTDTSGGQSLHRDRPEYVRRLVRAAGGRRAALLALDRRRLRARRRAAGRPRPRGTLGAAHDALRPRLPAHAAAGPVLVPQAQARVPAGRPRRALPPPLRARHA